MKRLLPVLAVAVVLLVGTLPALADDEQPQRPQAEPARSDAARLLEQLDTNRDGAIQREELPERIRARFDQLDTNKDGKLSIEELGRLAARSAPQRPGEFNAPPARGERIPDKLKVGDLAPDFTLPLASGQGEVSLKSYRGSKPVVLIFGSCT
jgi:hypothetical protein